MSNENYTGRNLYRVEVDTKKVNELLDRLNDDEAKKAPKQKIPDYSYREGESL